MQCIPTLLCILGDHSVSLTLCFVSFAFGACNPLLAHTHTSKKRGQQMRYRRGGINCRRFYADSYRLASLYSILLCFALLCSALLCFEADKRRPLAPLPSARGWQSGAAPLRQRQYGEDGRLAPRRLICRRGRRMRPAKKLRRPSPASGTDPRGN